MPPSSSAAFTKIFNDTQAQVEKNFGHKEAESFTDDLNILRHWLRAKEEIHVTYGKINYFLQKILKELGTRWTKQGYLSESGDIYYLDHFTIRDVIKNPANLLSIQEKQLFHNKSIACMYNKFKIPTLITSSMKSFGVSSVNKSLSSKDKQLQGREGSAGKVTGKARVILSLDYASEVKPGEILVTHLTSPGWTPLFSIIAGLVTETGGVLSHGAVVARECNIPAVLQVDNATTLIQTGDTISVDGDNGFVYFM